MSQISPGQIQVRSGTFSQEAEINEPVKIYTEEEKAERDVRRKEFRAKLRKIMGIQDSAPSVFSLLSDAEKSEYIRNLRIKWGLPPDREF